MLTTTLAAVIHLAMPAQFGGCAIEDIAAPVFDPAAPLSLDALKGDAPRNLVVLRAGLQGPAKGHLAHDATTVDLDSSGGVSLLEQFTAGPLVASDDYTFTVTDAFADGTDPEAPHRDVAFRSGDFTDDEAPRVTGEPTYSLQHIRGGPDMSCGPNWAPDQYIYTVDVPEAKDDHGVAAFELRLTVDGIESAFAAVINRPGEVMVAHAIGNEPTRVRIVALDHAGNQSAPVEATDGAQGGCSSTGSSTSLAVVLLALALQRRKRFNSESKFQNSTRMPMVIS